QKIISRLSRELSNRGMIDCIRHGIKDYGVTLKLAFNKPVSQMNQTLVQQYEQNIFTVSRQVYYSEKNNNSVDILLSLNGLPLVVMELKNHLTGQTVDNAITQFKKNRNPNELLFQFKKRELVYFDVDPYEVYMNTKLNKEINYYLLINQLYIDILCIIHV